MYFFLLGVATGNHRVDICHKFKSFHKENLKFSEAYLKITTEKQISCEALISFVDDDVGCQMLNQCVQRNTKLRDNRIHEIKHPPWNYSENSLLQCDLTPL